MLRTKIYLGLSLTILVIAQMVSTAKPHTISNVIGSGIAAMFSGIIGYLCYELYNDLKRREK